MYIDDMDGMETLEWSNEAFMRMREGLGVGIMLGPTEETFAFCVT